MNLGARVFIKGHVFLYQVSGGRIGRTILGLPVVIVTTRGRKTGAPRPVPLVPWMDGDQIHVIGSMGGSPKEPAWFQNLRANPDVEVQVGADRFRATARVLSSEERDRVWPRITAAMPNFGKYQQMTTRTIPVARLTQVS